MESNVFGRRRRAERGESWQAAERGADGCVSGRKVCGILRGGEDQDSDIYWVGFTESEA